MSNKHMMWKWDTSDPETVILTVNLGELRRWFQAMSPDLGFGPGVTPGHMLGEVDAREMMIDGVIAQITGRLRELLDVERQIGEIDHERDPGANPWDEESGDDRWQ